MTLDFLLTTLIIVATPGTGALYTLAAALGGGRRSAIIAAFGCTLGIIPHMLAAALGLAALVAAEPRLFEAIRYAGIAYLVWMAIGLWRSGLAADPAAEPRQEAWRIIRKAVLINLLNPKLSLFFLAFLPQFIQPGDWSSAGQTALLGLLFALIAALVFSAIALAAARIGRLLQARPRAYGVLQGLCGLLFIALALRLALADLSIPSARAPV